MVSCRPEGLPVDVLYPQQMYRRNSLSSCSAQEESEQKEETSEEKTE